MAQFLNGAELATYLGVAQTPTLDNIVARANDLVTEEWTANISDPPQQWVRNIAWNVAVRAGANPKGLTSQTRSWDDVTRTERWESAAKVGVYLTDDELATLQGVSTSTAGTASPAKSIRMSVPGWSYMDDSPWGC